MEIIDTFSNNSQIAICPYCGHENKYDSEYLTWEDGDESEVQCGKCDYDFVQIVSVQVTRHSLTLERVLRNKINNLKSNIKLNENREGIANNVKTLIEQWKKELEKTQERFHSLSAEKADLADPYYDY